MARSLGTPIRTSLAAAALTMTLTALLTACGEDTDEQAVDSPPTPSTSAPSDPTDPSDPSGEPQATEDSDEEWELLGLASETNAGGSVSTELTVVGDPDVLATYVDGFTSDVLAQEVSDLVAQEQPVPEGYAVAAAVVAVGCDVPTEVTYVDGELRAVKVPDPLPECFAPVTTVAVVAVPE